MKRIRNLLRNRMSRMLLMAGLATTAIILWGCGSYVSETYAGGSIAYAPDDMQYLAQYGDWINIEPYGMVWQPSVVDGWEPFYYGHWDWTDNGWAWVSYEPYGWLVYHYGYWDFQPSIGWFWISGDQWSPACVDWITYGDYIGWAPLPPPGVIWPEPWAHHDIGVWNVVRTRDFDRDNVGQYRIVKPPRTGELRQVQMEHNPPNVQMIETTTRRKIPRVTLQRRSMNMEFRQSEKQGTEGKMNRTQGKEHRQPEQGQVAERGGQKRDRELHRMVLPDREQRRVDKNRSRVEREVLRRHPESRGEGNARANERGGGRRR
jgi:hypothetical protein